MPIRYELSLFALLGVTAWGAPAIRAGAARIDITPDGPAWMSGYAARTRPSEGVLQRLWAKALALDDGRGGLAILVATDLIGLPRALTDRVAAEAARKYKLDRSQIVFNSTHTHTGPAVDGNLDVMVPEEAAERQKIRAYTDTLAGKLLGVIGASMADLAPARLDFGYTEARFAANRRQFTSKGVVIGVAPDGPVDHRVPVLRVVAPNGQVRAILFGYACHTTTLTAEFMQLSGDYAGFATAALESGFPGSHALFFMLCGGDQNPNPRSRLDLAEAHGHALAAAVSKLARGPMPPVGGRLRTVFTMTRLPFAAHTREQFEKEAQEKDIFRARRARKMLALYDERREPRTLDYPVQVVRFQKGFTLVALGGEVVIDYVKRITAQYPAERLMVAGYSNDVACYIPSARVLAEGGYEAEGSMVYYGQPGPFTSEVESRIIEAVAEAMKRASK
jgi:hypothetical protein